jgi:hypothetical protein
MKEEFDYWLTDAVFKALQYAPFAGLLLLHRSLVYTISSALSSQKPPIYVFPLR